ncbi:MAG TPA: phospholipase D-like domain-containing protein [Gemmatimonadales bacterium]|nr:phospholipase D-like domain-containing protein [Gemmatimonadales bacterium]
MSGRCLAIANNDIVHIAWSFDAPLPGCSGFHVFRLAQGDTGPGTPLRSLVAFEDRGAPSATLHGGGALPHDAVDPRGPQALIKGFKWRDLLAPNQRGVTVHYRIVAMQGDEAHATPLAGVPVLVTAPVTPSPSYGAVAAYFNRGILSTQSLVRTLAHYGGASLAALQKALADPNGSARTHLAGQLQDAVLSLLDRREKEGGDCYAALYELTDDLLIRRLEAAKSKLHIILSNNTGDAKQAYDAANHPARARLKQSGAELISRYLPESRSIGHNKFMVFVDKDGVPRAVLTGSTNWTASGLCTQNNNAVVVESHDLATRYLNYWKALSADTTAWPIPAKAAAVNQLQAEALRTSDAKPPIEYPLVPHTRASMWPSPNTAMLIPKAKKGDPPPPTPPDMQELFDACRHAKQAILVLVFQPGASGAPSSWTIIKELGKIGQANPRLFIRGAISDEAEALEFEAGRTAAMDAEMVAPAGILKDFLPWQREIYKAGHAVVHDKIVVIDPFHPECLVATGSHNLGFKASYNNDENLLLVRNNQLLAQAYAAHVADVFEHYRWRWYNKRSAERAAAEQWVSDGRKAATALDRAYDAANFFKAEIPVGTANADWQARYFDATRLASLERQFWVGGLATLPQRQTGVGMTSGLTQDEVAFRAARAALKTRKKARKTPAR